MSTLETAELVARLGRGRPVSVAQCEAAGIPRGRLRAARAAGLVTVVGRGMVAPAGLLDPDMQVADHLRLARALAERRGSAVVLSHETAALAHGMPLPSPAPRRVHLTSLVDQHDEDHDHVLHRAHHPRLPVTVVNGLPVTSLIRTALDVGRRRRLPLALIPIEWALRRSVIDHARRAGLTGPDDVLVEDARSQELARAELVREAAFFACRTGVADLRHIAEIASPLSESPLESRSRGEFLLAKIPILGQQVRMIDADGVARRADFLLADRLIGEADGAIKYEGPDGRGTLLKEKGRDRAMRGIGVETVRWSGPDITHDPASVIQQVREALATHRIWRASGR